MHRSSGCRGSGNVRGDRLAERPRISLVLGILGLREERMVKMSEEIKRLGAAIADALEVLPEGKKEYILGFAEGVAAMAAAMAAAKAEQTPDQIGA